MKMVEMADIVRIEPEEKPDVRQARVRIVDAHKALQEEVTIEGLQESKAAYTNYLEARVPPRKQLVLLNKFRLSLE